MKRAMQCCYSHDAACNNTGTDVPFCDIQATLHQDTYYNLYISNMHMASNSEHVIDCMSQQPQKPHPTWNNPE